VQSCSLTHTTSNTTPTFVYTALIYRDCEETAQVWMACADINIV
jgi:hypothetical protein